LEDGHDSDVECRSLEKDSKWEPPHQGATNIPIQHWICAGVLGDRSIAIDAATVPDPQDKHDEHLVTQFADEAIVSNPVAPKLRERTLQGLAEPAGVVQRLEALMQELNNAPRL